MQDRQNNGSYHIILGIHLPKTLHYTGPNNSETGARSAPPLAGMRKYKKDKGQHLVTRGHRSVRFHTRRRTHHLGPPFT
jgi:hypothetical protein